MKTKRSPGGESRPKRPVSEKVSFVVSLLILVALVGAVIHIEISPSERQARFELERGVMRVEDGRYYLEFTVRNLGDETAQNVMVEGSLMVGGKEERVSTTFDFVSGRSEESGVFIFSADPTVADIRVESYQKTA